MLRLAARQTRAPRISVTAPLRRARAIPAPGMIRETFLGLLDSAPRPSLGIAPTRAWRTRAKQLGGSKDSRENHQPGEQRICGPSYVNSVYTKNCPSPRSGRWELCATISTRGRSGHGLRWNARTRTMALPTIFTNRVTPGQITAACIGRTWRPTACSAQETAGRFSRSRSRGPPKQGCERTSRVDDCGGAKPQSSTPILWLLVSENVTLPFPHGLR